MNLSSDLLRAVSKFVETVHWKEALKILKLAVTRSSTLVAPPSSSSLSSSGHHHAASSSSSHLWEAHTSFAEAEVYFKKGTEKKVCKDYDICFLFVEWHETNLVWILWNFAFKCFFVFGSQNNT